MTRAQGVEEVAGYINGVRENYIVTHEDTVKVS